MRSKTKTHTLVLTALLAALLALLSPLTLPVGPVPVTLALFAVFFAGALLPPAAAMAGVGVYICLGAVGLPVFSGFRSGPQVLAGPTGGYIAGYFLIVLALSLAARRSQKRLVLLAAGLAGLAGCYLLGTLWFTLVTGAGFLGGLSVCVLPFVLPDLIKLAAALLLAAAVRRRLAAVGRAP